MLDDINYPGRDTLLRRYVVNNREICTGKINISSRVRDDRGSEHRRILVSRRAVKFTRLS